MTPSLLPECIPRAHNEEKPPKEQLPARFRLQPGWEWQAITLFNIEIMLAVNVLPYLTFGPCAAQAIQGSQQEHHALPPNAIVAEFDAN